MKIYKGNEEGKNYPQERSRKDALAGALNQISWASPLQIAGLKVPQGGGITVPLTQYLHHRKYSKYLMGTLAALPMSGNATESCGEHAGVHAE